ncbi:hypothetical protein [Lactobacillus taiwanensis]|uniref:hypothetical protein n=1 Tax=Lactobacillus taiwanensis TaxID=508451 RepID=UPI0032209C6C
MKERFLELVKFKNLKSDPNNRTVRAVVDSPYGQIKVFEPTTEDVEEIINLQDIISAFNEDNNEEEIREDLEQVLDISAVTVVKDLFPRLTDIEVDYMSDEEVQDIISHPNLALTQVKLIISGIISDIYKMMILSMGNRLKDMDLSNQSLKVQEKVMNTTIERLSETEEGKGVLEAMDETAKIDAALESNDPELKKKVAKESHMKLVSGKQESTTDYQSEILNKYVNNQYDDLKN